MTVTSSTESITVTAPSPAAPKSHFWDGAEFGFTDILAVINPLQHIPVVETLYRRLTGDRISRTARLAGDALYGGPVGLLGGYLNEKVMGKDAAPQTALAATIP